MSNWQLIADRVTKYTEKKRTVPVYGCVKVIMAAYSGEERTANAYEKFETECMQCNFRLTLVLGRLIATHCRPWMVIGSVAVGRATVPLPAMDARRYIIRAFRGIQVFCIRNPSELVGRTDDPSNKSVDSYLVRHMRLKLYLSSFR